MWKNGFNWLFRPSRTYLAFLDLNWPKIRSKKPKNDPKKPDFNLLKQDSCSVPQTVRESGLTWLSKPSRTFLATNWPRNEA